MPIKSHEQLKKEFAERKAILERKRNFKKKTPEEIKEQQKEYQKKYRETHKEYNKIKQAEYRERNREYIREYNKAWYHNQPKPDITDFPPPPIKNKKEVNQMYINWLNNLKEREQYLTGEALQYNILMQESIKNIMGRNRLKASDDALNRAIIGQQAKKKLKEIEMKAQEKIEEAKKKGDFAEVKVIQERLEMVRLRVKYSGM